MNISNRIPAVFIGTVATIIIAQPLTFAAMSVDEVGKIAKSITVLIDSKNPGSGVIIKRDGNTYTVLSARHVFQDPQAKYEIVTPDDKRYAVNYGSVKKLPNMDLAVVEFTSTETYSVAKIGNSDLVTEGKAAYVAGFPKTSAAISRSIYQFTKGQITANASRTSEDGYALVYSNNTLPGMSGGPILNENGELVGIHGRADTRALETSSINRDIQIAKIGFNQGIPINTSLRLLDSVNVDVGVKVSSAPVVTGLKADDFYIEGWDKYNKGDYQGAIAAYTQAIKLDPNYAFAYNSRGIARTELGDNQGAIADFNEVLRIDPNDVYTYYNRGIARRKLGDNQGAIADYNAALRIDPNYANAYISRGNARSELGDKQGALADFNEALRINPNYALAYYNRGIVRRQLGDRQGAIADYDRALQINPNYANAYYNRAIARYKLGDMQGAIADYNEALRINPNDALTYINRGIARHKLGDMQGELADYDRALQINPNYVDAYINRGIARYDLGDKQSAIADYNAALRINPNVANAYYNRGLARAKSEDKQGAIADFQKAADLYQQQGNRNYYQSAINKIREIESNTPTRSTPN
ncbi:MAG: serine protease [Richelia sp. CSU_2_1]|nr:serine protease [Richelia sp. CSU_2_1]